MEDYQSLIIKRCSIRKYDMNEFSATELQNVIDIVQNVTPFNACKYNIKIITHPEFFTMTGGLFRIDAPHYLVISGDGTDEGLINVGFISEQICLHLASFDVGTVFLGGAFVKDKLQKSTYAISVALGRPLEPFRDNIGNIKRKKLADIAEGNTDAFLKQLQNARLAPSAMNLQPWYFICQEKEIDVYLNKARLLSSIKKMQKIDIGIVLSHFLVDDVSFIAHDNKKTPKGRKYITSVTFNK